MSLLLRNACQDTLDNAQLSNFHIRVNEYSKAMTIVGECGQPFVSISGIKFARVVPSNAELPLAVELLDAFLMKHKPDFDLYVQELAKFKSLPVVEMELNESSLDFIGYNDTARWVSKVRSGCFQITINTDGTLFTIDMNGSDPAFSIAECAKGPNLKHMQAGLAHLHSFIAYEKAEETVKALKEKLSSCEI